MLDPKISFYLNILLAALGVIVAGGPHIFPSYVPDAWASAIAQTAGFVVALVSGINAALHGYSAPVAGPLTSDKAESGAKALSWLAAFLLLPVMFGLGGCNSVSTIDPGVATAKQVGIMIDAYNAAVTTGTVYLKLPLCPDSAPACRTQTLSQSVYTALKSGRTARAQLLAAVRAHAAAPLTAIQAIEAAYSIIEQIPAF